MDFKLDGLASGMDTKNILAQMRYIEEQPIRDLEDDISQTEQEKNAWRDINSRMSKLDNLIGDLKNIETYTSKTAESSDTDILSVTANTDATAGNYEITVDAKAQAQKVVSDDISTTLGKADSEELGYSGDFVLDGNQIDVVSSDSLIDIKDKINSSEAEVSATVIDNQMVLESQNTGAAEENKIRAIDADGILENIGVYSGGADNTTVKSVAVDDATAELGSEGSFDLYIGGTNQGTVDVTSTDSLNDLADKIDAAAGSDVASVASGELTIAGTGAVTFKNITGDNVINELKIANENETFKNAKLKTAQDAQVTIEGISTVNSATNSFDDSISGLDFTIANSAATGDTATIEVADDTNKTYDAIKSVVDQYNSVVDFIDGKTDKDKVLQGDGSANRIISSLKTKLLERIETGTSISHMSQIGIEFDENNYNKLTINQSELESAVKENATQVHEFFASDMDDGDSYDGLATKLKDYTNAMVESDGIIPGREDMLNTQIENMEDSISDYEEQVEMRMQTMEEQFTEMETTLSDLNNQGSWLSSQISSMGLSGGLTSMMG